LNGYEFEVMEQTITNLLRLDENVVGWKFIRSESELSGIARAKRKVYSCQMLKVASQGGYVLAATENELSCSYERFVFGMMHFQDSLLISHLNRYAKTKDTAMKWLMENLPKTKCKGVAVGPLSKIRFAPDVIYIPVNSWQATRCIQACTYESGENLNFLMGMSALPCAYGAVYTYTSGKPNLVTACSGARVYGKFDKNELAFFIPFSYVNRFTEGLKDTDKKGLKCPLFLYLGFPPQSPKSIFTSEYEQS